MTLQRRRVIVRDVMFTFVYRLLAKYFYAFKNYLLCLKPNIGGRSMGVFLLSIYLKEKSIIIIFNYDLVLVTLFQPLSLLHALSYRVQE